jgi:hypothetical protein
MTEHLTLNTVIHEALRRDLRRFGNALHELSAGDAERAEALGVAWENFDHQLHHHHEDEETILLPVLRDLGADEATMEELAGTHAGVDEALATAERWMKTLRATPSSDSIAGARGAMLGLTQELEPHLSLWERDLEPVAAANRDARPFKQAVKEVRKAHKGETGTFFAWLGDGADDDARAALRREVPASVRFLAGGSGGRHYRRTVAAVWN